VSRSSPTIQNPASHFIDWRGGKLGYWDKEQEKVINVPLPFSFMPLDQLHTITGYSDTDQSGFWSNETKSTKDTFNVRTKKGTRYVGAYKNAQGIPQVPTGARYTKSVYIAYKDGATYQLANLKLTGAALNAWIDFCGHQNVENGTVTLTGSTEGKKGATTYQIPTFEYRASTDEEDKMATNLDKVLQSYLSEYLKNSDEDEQTGTDEPMTDSFNTNNGKATPEQVADFEKRKADKAAKKQLDANDFPDDDAESQSLYNSIAGNEDVPFDDGDLPPEFRG